MWNKLKNLFKKKEKPVEGRITEVEFKALEELYAGASPAPWGFNGYSCMLSIPLMNQYNDAAEALPEGSPDWMYEKLPEYIVCDFPVVAGDTATPQGFYDAALIEKMHKYFPLLIAEVRRLRTKYEPVDS
jgi:hypothetical protein